jgi:hypothetical protein
VFLREVSLASLPGPIPNTYRNFFKVEAQSLIEFWQENFKVQVEARSGVLRIHHEGGVVMRL